MALRIAIRADSSMVIGRGHVERCLALADGLHNRGGDVEFICRAHDGHLGGRIAERGHKLRLLPLSSRAVSPGATREPSEEWLGNSWSDDAGETSQVLLEMQAQWVVVDHYGIDARWETAVKAAAGVRVMAIDGLANRAHDCEIVLDPTLSSANPGRWLSLVPPGCLVLAGPQYALIRQEFLDERRRRRTRRVVRRLLISFGGADRFNATGMALEAAGDLVRSGLDVDVVASCRHPRLSELEAVCASLPRAGLHVETSGMARLMAGADLAIGSGGISMWERCSVGLPALLVPTSPHEYEPCRSLEEAGGGVLAGSIDDPGIGQKLSVCLTKVISDQSRLRAMSDAAYELIGTRQDSVPETVYVSLLGSTAGTIL